jgi:hypothetical protein
MLRMDASRQFDPAMPGSTQELLTGYSRSSKRDLPGPIIKIGLLIGGIGGVRGWDDSFVTKRSYWLSG